MNTEPVAVEDGSYPLVGRKLPLPSRMLYQTLALPFAQLVCPAIRSWYTSEVHVDGVREHLYDAEGGLVPGPRLWIGNHVHADYYNALPLWWRVGRPHIKIMGRGNYLVGGAGAHSRFFDWFLSFAKRDVIREGDVRAMVDKGKLNAGDLELALKKMRGHNAKTLFLLAQDLQQGCDVGVMPEGTRKKDGRTMQIRKGVYVLGKLSGVIGQPCGLSYDSMCGKGGKDIFFFRLGDPFRYEALPGDSTDPGYAEADWKIYATEVKQRLLSLHTVTAAGLMSDWLVSWMLEQRSEQIAVSFADLRQCVSQRVHALDSLSSPVHMDPALRDASALWTRVQNYCAYLVQEGYARESVGFGVYILHRGAILHDPPDEVYRLHPSEGGNRLKFQSNILRRFADSRPDVGALLDYL